MFWSNYVTVTAVHIASPIVPFGLICSFCVLCLNKNSPCPGFLNCEYGNFIDAHESYILVKFLVSSSVSLWMQ
jgi:hypothetical protein